MSFDTKYRPNQFDGVIGQEATVAILMQFVKSGKGFHQSYIFAGAKGCGKTSLGRILARALLCDSPEDGKPCDDCPSCLEMLQDPPSNECYTEMDAANNSGKENILSIVEGQKYDTFSGRKRIYLIDETHRLSKQAMDGLLKSLEDTVPGSEDKILVCIFCTTEPDKLVGTISSRCAPTFEIRQVPPEIVAKRCEEVCKGEDLKYEFEALVLIAEVKECHFRDALKAVEGVSMVGDITVENVRSYLNLGASSSYLKILASLGSDQNAIVSEIETLKFQVSPSTCYAKMAEAAVDIYKAKKFKVGRIPSYWDKSLLEPFVGPKLEGLLEISSWLAKRPSRATYSMLSCDLLSLGQRVGQGVSLSAESVVVAAPVQASAGQVAPKALTPTSPQAVVAGKVEESVSPDSTQKVQNGVYIDSRCFRRDQESKKDSVSNPDILELDLASKLLQGRIRELISGSSRSTR